ncbi:MAG: IS630 family transposase [bacterium]|nr:IS630 family transposase [bacterium]
MKVTIAHYIFPVEEIRQLREYRDKQRDDRLKLRFVALLMLVEEVAIEIVASVIGKSASTIERWGDHYLTKGIDSLNSFQYTPKQTYLKPAQIEQLVTWVNTTNPAKTKQVKTYIKKEFRVSYSVEAVRVLMHKHGLKRLRPKTQPGKPPTVEEQQEFVANYEQMKTECEPGTVFRFVDAMHLVHQNTPGYCWGDPNDPPVMQTNSGRKRLNILGAYNPADYSLVHVTGEASCNGERVIELLEKIEAHDSTAPEVVLFSDNAKYFYSGQVREWIDAHPRCWLLPLPPYAPNLNLIERLWKFAKEELVTNTYYEKYKTFRAQVFRFLNHMDRYVDELKTLMVEKFQIIQPKVAPSLQKPVLL